MPTTVFNVPLAWKWSPRCSLRLAAAVQPKHDLVTSRRGIAMPGDDLHAETGEITGLDPDLNEHGIVCIDVLGLHEHAHGTLDPCGLADPGQLVTVDRARQRV